MHIIDLRTVIIITTLLGGLMALALELICRSAPSLVAGLRHWVNAAWLVFISALLFGLRDLLPVAISVTLANGLLLAAFAVMLQGTRQYVGQAAKWLPDGLLWGATMVGVVWFAHVDPSFRGRTVCVVGSLGWLMIQQARLFLRGPVTTVGARFVGFPMAYMSLVFVVRWVHALVFPQIEGGLYGTDWVQVMYMVSYSFVLLVIMVGFVLLASERLRLAFEYQATHDALTGAFNRRALLERLAQELARSQRYQRTFAVLMLDLDHFKQVNDQHGHQVGDEVLKQFVQRIGQILRPNDTLGRLGGEEFLVLLPETPTAAAQATAQRILAAVAEHSDTLPVCTTSIGLTTWLPQDDSAQALMVRADRAMYAAKANGRNRVEVL